MAKSTICLTEYSHGSGCGCKIAPRLLGQILQSSLDIPLDPNLLVGNQSRDDAAVYNLGNGSSIISTADFFMPIVDDAFEFGQIAASNAISDIYAMGGTPLMAIAIFGWPIDKLGPEDAQEVLDGGRSVCKKAGIPLAGGHSIDTPEPIFGLAVTGTVDNQYLKRNDEALPGSLLYLTKPLGIGILSTAQKRKMLSPEHERIAPDIMCRLNSIGTQLARIEGISAMTDVTGFGLLGHLTEVCQGSNVRATIRFDQVPTLEHVLSYLEMGCSPGGAERNFASYGQHVSEMTKFQQQILTDPQTSGGLLVAVNRLSEAEFLSVTLNAGMILSPIGELHEASTIHPLITVL